MRNQEKIIADVIEICFQIHRKLGPGLFESVYVAILCHELNKYGYAYTREQAVPLIWNDLQLEVGFRTDIIVENKVIFEIKSIETLAPVHKKQILTYLKLTGITLGLIINFNEALLKDGICRVINSKTNDE